MSYTKGPWADHGNPTGDIFGSSGTYPAIIECDSGVYGPHGDDRLLILAAPELYETVKAFMEVPGLVDGLPLHIYDMAQKAIAKAEGHQDSES